MKDHGLPKHPVECRADFSGYRLPDHCPLNERAVRVTLPVKTVSELNTRGHWSARAKRMKRARRLAYALTPAAPLPAIVTLVRLSPGTLDDDNLRGALKGVRDGVADRLSGGDDRHPLVEWRYAQETCKRGQFGVRIEIMGGK